MTADEAFQVFLRTLSAGVWTVIVYRVWSKRMDADRLDALITAATLAIVLTVVAVGGLAGTAGIVPGAWVRIAYTATATGAFAAGVILLVRH